MDANGTNSSGSFTDDEWEYWLRGRTAFNNGAALLRYGTPAEVEKSCVRVISWLLFMFQVIV